MIFFFPGGSFFGSAGFVFRFIRRCLIEDYFTIVCLMAAIRCVCVCVFELCWATDITAGTQLKSLRLQIKQNVTINVAKEQGELWWASLWGFTWLSGGAGTWDNRNAELSLPCSALVWLWLLLHVCVCVCVLGNPVEMKGAATHWPGDYSITFVSVPGLNCSFPFLKLAFYC